VLDVEANDVDEESVVETMLDEAELLGTIDPKKKKKIQQETLGSRERKAKPSGSSILYQDVKVQLGG
jgi:hypothetical protein